MATKFITTYDSLHEEDYIDIILTSDNFIPCRSSIDFEFQNPFNPNHEEPSFFPADDLFCNGKLLPLYPRKNGREISHPSPDLNPIHEELYNMIKFTKSCDSRNCPLDDICQWASCLDDDEEEDGFFEWSSVKLSSFVELKPCKKLSWIDKVVKFILHRRVKASRAGLKSLLLEVVCCACEYSCEQTTLNAEESWDDRKTSSVPTTASAMNNIMTNQSSPKWSSYCSSAASSSRSFDACFLRGSSYFGHGSDVSIDAAIAYCKKSLKDTDSGSGNDFEDTFVEDWVH